MHKTSTEIKTPSPEANDHKPTSSAQCTLKVCLDEETPTPYRAHPNDVGLDLTVRSFEQRGPTLFFYQTGVKIIPPKGYYIELIPRSSIVWRGFIMPNSLGVIDPGYRGPLMIPLLYVGHDDPLTAAQTLIGQRVVQMVLRALHLCDVEVINEDQLTHTQRGEGRFGSTSGDEQPT